MSRAPAPAREGRSALANIFAEFASVDEKRDCIVLSDGGEKISQDILATFDGLQKKSDNTRLKWSLELAELAKEYAESSEADRIFERIKGDMIHALSRCASTADMNMQVREQFLKSILALLTPSEHCMKSLENSERINLLTALLQFRYAQSTTLSRLASRIISLVLDDENIDQTISQAQYKAITKALVEIIPRYIMKLEASPESDGCASLVSQALFALALCIRNIKSKANLTTVLENLKILNYASASDLPSVLKLSGLEVCESILTYCLNNDAADQIPPKLIKQISKLNDQESDVVLRKRLTLASFVLEKFTESKLQASTFNDALTDLLRKLFNVCITASAERNAGAINACVTQILLPLLTRERTEAGQLEIPTKIPAHWISPLRKCDGELDLRSATVILLLRCCFMGVRRNHIILDCKDLRMHLDANAKNLLPQKGARSDAYFAKIWELISCVCDRVWCVRCIQIREKTLNGTFEGDNSDLKFTPLFPPDFTTGSSEIFQKNFISNLLDKEDQVLSLNDLKTLVSPESEILFSALIESGNPEELRERLTLHLKNSDHIDDISSKLITANRLKIDADLNSIILEKLRTSSEIDLATKMAILKQLEIDSPISAVECAAKAIQDASKTTFPAEPVDLSACLDILIQSILSRNPQLTDELVKALRLLVRPEEQLAESLIEFVMTNHKEDLSKIIESNSMITLLPTNLLSKLEALSSDQAIFIEDYFLKHSELYIQTEGEVAVKNNLVERLETLLSASGELSERELTESLQRALSIFGTDWWLHELSQCSDTKTLLKLIKIKPSVLYSSDKNELRDSVDLKSSILLAYAQSLSKDREFTAAVIDETEAYDHLVNMIKNLESDGELRADRTILMIKAALSAIEDSSISSREKLTEADNDRREFLKYLQVRFEQTPRDVTNEIVSLPSESLSSDSRSTIGMMTACIEAIRAGLWLKYRSEILEAINKAFSQSDALIEFIAQELICFEILPILEGFVNDSSTVKDINDFFAVSSSIWLVARDASNETAQILLLPICGDALNHLWEIFREPGFDPSDVCEIVRFLNEVIQFTRENSSVKEHIYKFLESYRCELIPPSGVSRSLLLRELKKALRTAQGADTADHDSDAFWCIVELVFGPMITELLASIVQADQVDLRDIQLINSLVLSSLRTQFERKTESEDTVASPLVSEIISYMDPMTLFLQNLFSLKNKIAVDPKVIEQLGVIKCSIKIPRESSLLEYILKTVLMRKQNVQKIDSTVSQTIEILTAYAPSCLWQSIILQKSEKAYLTVLVERFGHKAYKARIHEQVLVINRLLTSKGVLAHFDAGSAHVRVWDNPEYKEASLDIDIHVDLSPNIPISLPRIAVDTELKGFAESTKFHFYQILKSSSDSQTFMGEYAGSGGQNFILAVARIADQFHENFQELEDCVICYSRLHRLSKTPPTTICPSCSNHYHQECLQQWFLTHNTRCPMCRRVFM